MIKLFVQVFFGIVAIIAACIGLFGFYFPTIMSANDDTTVIGGLSLGLCFIIVLIIGIFKFFKFICTYSQHFVILILILNIYINH